MREVDELIAECRNDLENEKRRARIGAIIAFSFAAFMIITLVCWLVFAVKW